MYAYLIYRSLDEPPRFPAVTPTHRQNIDPVVPLTSTLTQIAGAMTQFSQFSVLTTSPISPAKMASLCNNYLQQMRMLLESGAISKACSRMTLISSLWL